MNWQPTHTADTSRYGQDTADTSRYGQDTADTSRYGQKSEPTSQSSDLIHVSSIAPALPPVVRKYQDFNALWEMARKHVAQFARDNEATIEFQGVGVRVLASGPKAILYVRVSGINSSMEVDID